MRLVRNENERGSFLFLSNSWDVSFSICVCSMKLDCHIFVIFQDNLTENFLSFIALLLHIVNQSYWMLVWAAEIADKDVYIIINALFFPKQITIVQNWLATSCMRSIRLRTILHTYFKLLVVGNKAKRRISKRVFQENKVRQIFQKTNISYALIRTRTCPYQGVRNVCFSENLACFVFLKHPFWDSPFYVISNVLTFPTPPLPIC